MKSISTKQMIFSTVSTLIIKYGNTSCRPKLEKIQYLLKKIYNRERTIRSINRHLKALQEDGLIKSYRNRVQREDGTWYNKPSNRSLTARGINCLKKLRVFIPKWLTDWAYKHILPKHNTSCLARDPQRPPQVPYINSPTALKAIFAPLIA